MHTYELYRGIYEQQGVHATEISIWNCHSNHLVIAVCLFTVPCIIMEIPMLVQRVGKTNSGGGGGGEGELAPMPSLLYIPPVAI